MFTLSIATTTVSVDTIIEFGQTIKKHHFKMFALSIATNFFEHITPIIFYVLTLSVATATICVNTIIFVLILTTIIFSVFTLSFYTAHVSVDTIIFCVNINNCHFLRIYTKR